MKKTRNNSQITIRCPSYPFLSRKMKRFPFVMVTVTSAPNANQSQFTSCDWLIVQRKPTVNLSWLQITAQHTKVTSQVLETSRVFDLCFYQNFSTSHCISIYGTSLNSFGRLAPSIFPLERVKSHHCKVRLQITRHCQSMPEVTNIACGRRHSSCRSTSPLVVRY